MTVWLDGRVVDADAARVSVFDRGLTVGDGVFETVKVVDGRLFALSRHLERLAHSARCLGLPDPDLGGIRRGVGEALAAAGTTPLQRVRITVTGGTSPLGSERGHGPLTVVVVVAPLGAWPATAAVATVPWPRNERGATAGLKTTSYAENVVALARAKAAGAGEAVLANTAGMLCEGTGSNVFCEVDGTLVTPPLSAGPLAGVTRALVLEWCPHVVERDVPMAAFRASREIFLTSTTRDVQPVHAIDGESVGDRRPGPLTLAVQAAFARRAAAETDP